MDVCSSPAATTTSPTGPGIGDNDPTQRLASSDQFSLQSIFSPRRYPWQSN